VLSHGLPILIRAARGDHVVPVGLALRIFGEHLAADLGFIFVKEVLDEGFPIPWVTVAYNFGR
jgi:hypothetical protein